MSESEDQDFSIVALDRFIEATRDSGYKGTSSAVAELVDNALQAQATEIDINLTVDDAHAEHPITVTLLDNGVGMNARTLRTALRFGGSTRFNDRSGLGRYGMGLPNSSLSQAQRVTVYSWGSKGGQVLSSYLDLEEIASGNLTEVPRPVRVTRPTFINGHASGTAVQWTRCDRLDNRRVTTLSRKLLRTLGRQFRHYLWNNVTIRVNGDAVLPVDPLFLHPETFYGGAKQYAEDMVYEVAADPNDPSTTGIVRVKFSELPVAQWSKLSNKDKHARGIAKGAGVSIVRGGREVDYGWFFLGGKRRENYDDWWRCEVHFEPVLDEAFGITHTKQQVRPRPHLQEAIGEDMEAVARALNARARKAHVSVKTAERFNESVERATAKDELLTPLPRKTRARDKRVLNALGRSGEAALSTTTPAAPGPRYRIIPKALNEAPFFNYAREDGRLDLVLNPEHPFYAIVYKPLLDSDAPRDQAFRTQLDLVLLASARSEALLEDKGQVENAERMRAVWSDTLATFLNS